MNPPSRSPLSTSSLITWFRTRFSPSFNSSRPNHHYLYFPQQLLKQTSIQKIFTQFDADGSGGLSRQEVYDMFHAFGIGIGMEDLDRLYESVDGQLEEMDCEGFKKCALGQESNRIFREIVGRLGEGYYPHDFANMIIYIVYRAKRQELRKGVTAGGIGERVGSMEKILKLDDLALNNQRLANHTQHYKQAIRNNLRDVWEKVNQKYGQNFPFGSKLQQQFYQFCLKNFLQK